LLDRPLGFFGLAVLIVMQLLCTVAMFQALRPGMPRLARAAAEGLSTSWAARSRLTDAIAVALLPFFAYYATWGLLRDVVAEYSHELLRHIAGLDLPGPQDLTNGLGLWMSIGVTWLVRRISLTRHAKTRSPLWSIVATVCEGYWVFLGVLVIGSWKQMPWEWWHSRVVYVAWQGWWEDPHAWLTPLEQVVEPVLTLLQKGVGVVILPLIWLAIAAIVYGHDLRDPAGLAAAHRRVERLHQRYVRLPVVVRAAAERWSDGWRHKGVPVVNSLRLLLRAGLRPALALCVCYVTLDFVCSWAFRGAVWLIGPQERDVWNIILGPLTLVVGDASAQNRSLLEEPLRICLLAAAIELTFKEAQAPMAAVAEGALAPEAPTSA
ncbi:MAG: hypothetical protein ACRD2X_25120, partial [Vicinamibacteraceae bacterium]